MIRTIIQQDWWLIRQSTLYKILGLVFLGTLIIAAMNGHRLYRHKLITYSAIDSTSWTSAEKLKSQLKKIESGTPYEGSPFADPRSPYAVGNTHLPRYLVFPLHPLAQWSVGESDIYPTYYRVTASKMQSMLINEEIANPRIQFLGALDISFMLIYLLPLLIIGFTYNLSASEYESGTLRMLLAEPVSFQRIIAIKFGFRFLLTSLTLFTVLLITAVVTGIPVLDGNLWLFITFAWTYAGFWFALSWLINALSRKNSGTSSAVLVGLWIILVVLVPGAISLIAKTIYPMPSRIELITQTREASAAITKQNSDVLGRYLQDHPDLVKDTAGIKPDDFAVKAFTAVLETEKVVAPLEQSFEVQYSRQRQLAGMLGYLSPALIMQLAMNNTAMTDENSFSGFKQYTAKFFRHNRDFYTQQIVGQKKMSSNAVDTIPSPDVYSHQAQSMDIFAFYFCVVSLMCVFIGAVAFRKANVV